MPSSPCEAVAAPVPWVCCGCAVGAASPPITCKGTSLSKTLICGTPGDMGHPTGYILKELFFR